MKNPWDINEQQEKSKEEKESKIKSSKIKDEDKKEFLDKILKDFNIKKDARFTTNGTTIYLIGIVLFLLWFATGIYKVNSDENGVVSYFGKYHETTTPGLHFYVPYPIGTIKKVSTTRINKEEFGFSSANDNIKAFDEESLMLTGDENIADIDFEVQWKINNVKDYLFNIKDQKTTIRSATESVMREIIANREIDDILANKKFEIESEAKKLLQDILNSYGSGIEIITVQLLRADPPKEVINAFRDVQTAKADKESKINEAQSYNNDIMPKARGEAEAIIQNAEAYKKAIVSKAEGEAERFDKLYTVYRFNKDITKKRIYIETMEEIMKNNDKIIIDKNINGNFLHLLNDKK
ncbi:MAG TPA: FtsH protease activity modulator HflK [Rickettsiales bacterium]|nr:FtsH protease activity modulator HflK [Rickettsiales bacterium]